MFVHANSKMMDACGDAEGRLGAELMHHEMQIEKDILEPLNQLAEVEMQTLTSFSCVKLHLICRVYFTALH